MKFCGEGKVLTITLKEVNEEDYSFLYELLSERDPNVSISHRKMPTYEEHVQFVKSNPYSKWYIIYDDDKKNGSIYLTKQNEIGIFIKKNMQGHGIGKKAMKLLMEKNPRERYLANVNPKNTKSISFFKKNNFQLIQYTYELTSSSLEKIEK